MIGHTCACCFAVCNGRLHTRISLFLRVVVSAVPELLSLSYRLITFQVHLQCRKAGLSPTAVV